MAIPFQQFSAAVGSTFIVHTQNGMLELKLVEAVEHPRRGLPEHLQTPCSLVFSGPTHTLLSQDSYWLDHPNLGRVQWLLVPISRYATPEFAATLAEGVIPGPDQVPQYEAVFN